MTTRRKVSAMTPAAAIETLDARATALTEAAMADMRMSTDKRAAGDKHADAMTDAVLAATRKCIGSAKFGIEAHDAPPADFPVQPSQKDGLGRMCKPHWREYVRALGRSAKARKNDPLDLGARIAHDVPAATIAEAWDNAQTARAVLDEVEPTRQSQAATRVATKRAARVASPEAIKVRTAKAVVAAAETLAGKAYTDAVGSDEVQEALDVIANGRTIGTIDPADSEERAAEMAAAEHEDGELEPVAG